MHNACTWTWAIVKESPTGYLVPGAFAMGPGLLEIFVVVVVSPTLDLYSTHPPHFCEYVTPFHFLPKVFHPKRQHNSLCILISLCVSDNMVYPLMSLSITYTYPHSYPLWGLLLNIMVFAKNLEEDQYGSKVCPSSQVWAGSKGLAPRPPGSVPLRGCIMLIRARFTFRSSILADQVTCFECKSVWKYKRLWIETILCSHIRGTHFHAFFAFIAFGAFGAGAAAAFIAFFAMVVSTWRTGESCWDCNYHLEPCHTMSDA